MFKRGLLTLLVMGWLPAAPLAFGQDVYITEKANVFSTRAIKDWKLSFKSLDDWIARDSHKEWRLLYKKETKEDYIALFLDEDGRLVVATWRRDGVEPWMWQADVTGADKRDAYDHDGMKQLFMRAEISSVPYIDENGNALPQEGGKQWATGYIYAIRKNYAGNLRILVQDRLKNGDPMRVILDYTFQWPVPK